LRKARRRLLSSTRCNVAYTRAVILAAEPKPNGHNGT
jgi:hypothetical protein